MVQIKLFWEQDKTKKFEGLQPGFLQLVNMVPWESFRPMLESGLSYSDLGKGGRPSYDVTLMFRIIVLQNLNDLSDDAMEFMLYDRLSFRQFVGLKPHDSVPDAKTIWVFKNRLAKNNAIDELFENLNKVITAAGFYAQGGQIIDATILETRKPAQKKEDSGLSQATKNQIDKDATFTKKHGKTYHGYKAHVNVDKRFKLVREFSTTTASMHDSQVFEEILDEDNTAKALWADSAYKSEKHDKMLDKKMIRNRIQHRAYRNCPMNGYQKRSNKAHAKIRCRVEHVFGSLKNWGKKIHLRTIGLVRAKFNTGLKLITYNMRRWKFLLETMA